MKRSTSIILSVVGMMFAAKAVRGSTRSDESVSKAKDGPSRLSKRQWKVVRVGGVAWALTLLIVSILTGIEYPDDGNALFVGSILLLISAPHIAVASAMIPHPHLGGAVQYRRIQRLREVTGIQAVIGGAGLALLLNFEQSVESEALLTSLFLWTAASLFHFVLLWAQARMETPQYTETEGG